MTRELLPQRRHCETFTFVCWNQKLHATVGYYADGRVGELFINSKKSGTDLNIALRDSAIAVSFALQHGASIREIREAFSRRSDGSAEGPLGLLLDLLAKPRLESVA